MSGLTYVFAAVNLLVLPCWLLMIGMPAWRGTRWLMRSPLPVAVFAAVYAGLVIPRLPTLLPLVASPRLDDVVALLGTADGATIAWVHFLALDLFVGRWAYFDSHARGINPWLMAPVLLLTLLFAPLGYLAYLSVRVLYASDPRPLLVRLWRTNAALTMVGGLMMATLLGTLVGLVVDPQVITGAPAWLKPTKFAISTAIYSFTLVWLLGFVRGHPRLVALVGNASAVALTIEVAIICAQVVRGTTSHFNNATPLDATLFQIMGGFIVLVWLMGLLTAGLLIRQRLPDPVLGWSLRLGVLIALVGMAVAFFMVVPTSEQRALLASAAQRLSGAHSVGVLDGGPGLPLVGWSTVAGDLRVAHFVGLHGLQVLPLLGWLIGRATWLPIGHRAVLIVTAGLAYLGLVAVLAWQALRGQSVIAPDGLTIGAVGLLVGVAGLVVALAVVRGWAQANATSRVAVAALDVRVM